MRAHVAPPWPHLSPPPLCTHVCGRIPSARVHNARRARWKIYIRGTERAEMYSPNYLRIGVPNFPPPLPLSVSSKERAVPPSSSSSSSLPLFQAPSLRSPWSTAHLHGMHSYEIDHSSNDFSSRLCIPRAYSACMPRLPAIRKYMRERARARDKSRQGHSRET